MDIVQRLKITRDAKLMEAEAEDKKADARLELVAQNKVIALLLNEIIVEYEQEVDVDGEDEIGQAIKEAMPQFDFFNQSTQEVVQYINVDGVGVNYIRSDLIASVIRPVAHYEGKVEGVDPIELIVRENSADAVNLNGAGTYVKEVTPPQ